MYIKSVDQPQYIHHYGATMILFYRERNGDYLAIDTITSDYYRTMFGQNYCEGRATAMAGQLGSVCTTAISRDYLRRNCKRVPRAAVPADWLCAIG